MTGSPEISAIDFEIALAALRRLAPLPIAATELRALAKGVIEELCPDTRCPAALIDALVAAAGQDQNLPEGDHGRPGLSER